MIQLLKKLRIDFTSVVMLQGVSELPKEATAKFHNKLLNGFREGENDQCFVSNNELDRMRDKTNRQLRLREMLREHSKKANLIVMSLPMPRQVSCKLTFVSIIYKLFFFAAKGRSIGTIIHVLVRGFISRNATNAVCPWQSNLSIDLLLVKVIYLNI